MNKDQLSASKDMAILIKLMILELYYVHEIPAEIIAKATGMNPNSIRNMFPKQKRRNNKKKNG